MKSHICNGLMIWVCLFTSGLWAIEVIIDEEIEDQPVATSGSNGAMLLRSFAVPGTTDLSSFALAPDNKLLACVVAKQQIVFLDFASGAVQGKIQCAAGINDVAFHPRENQIAIASNDGSASLWSVKSCKLIRNIPGHNDVVQSLAFSPDGSMLAIASDSGLVNLNQVSTGRQLHSFSGHSNQVSAVVFSQDARTILTEASDVSARLWDAARMMPLCRLPDRDGEAAALAISPNGRLGASTRGDASWQLFEIPSGNNVLRLIGHIRPGSSAIFSQDGLSLFTGGFDGAIRQWDLFSGQEIRRIFCAGGKIDRLALSKDGCQVLSLCAGRLELWDVAGPFSLSAVADTYAGKDEQAWVDLKSTAYEVRMSAVAHFASGEQASLEYLIRQLVPAKPLAEDHVRDLIGKLDDDRYVVREDASRALKRVSALAFPHLQHAQKAGSAEVQLRAMEILSASATPEQIQRTLALELLGWSKLPQARKHLEALASGLRMDPQTRLAQAILERARP